MNVNTSLRSSRVVSLIVFCRNCCHYLINSTIYKTIFILRLCVLAISYVHLQSRLFIFTVVLLFWFRFLQCVEYKSCPREQRTPISYIISADFSPWVRHVSTLIYLYLKRIYGTTPCSKSLSKMYAKLHSFKTISLISFGVVTTAHYSLYLILPLVSTFIKVH